MPDISFEKFCKYVLVEDKNSKTRMSPLWQLEIPPSFSIKDMWFRAYQAERRSRAILELRLHLLGNGISEEEIEDFLKLVAKHKHGRLEHTFSNNYTILVLAPERKEK